MSADLELPELGFGAAQLGNLYRPTPPETAQAAVDAAWEEGVRYFDTAPHYGIGLSEERLGAALAARPRDEYLLSTKVGRLLIPGPGTGDDMAHGFAVPGSRRRVWDMSTDGVRRSLEESLERMGLDRIDIAYLHDPEEGPTQQAFDDALPALERLREEGVIRAFGVGSKDPVALDRALRTVDVDVLMMSGRYTLLDRRAQDDLLPDCVDRGVQVVAVSVFNSGILARPTPADNALFEYEQASPDLLERARAMAALATENGVELPDLAVRFPLRHPAIACVVLGMRTPEHVRQNAARMRVSIPERIWQAIDEL